MILYINIGNTRVKFAIQYEGEIVSTTCELATIHEDFVAALSHFLRSYPKVSKIVYCSVVTDVDSFVLACLDNFDAKIVIVSADMISKVNFSKYPQLGNDRRMVCEAVAPKYEHAIVIDFGTATTINVVYERCFEGGIIMPGIEMGYTALTERTSKINVVSIKAHPNLLGLDTLSNVSSGVINMTALAINSLIKKLESQFQCTFSVFITGGNSHYLLDSLDFKYSFDDNLLIKGMIQIAKEV